MVAQKKHYLKVSLARSTNKCLEKHKACVLGLGLRRVGHTVKVLDTPENRGMIEKISYLLKVEN